MTGTSTVRRLVGLSTSTHYVLPDADQTLCEIPLTQTDEHLWPLALASCSTCQREAKRLGVGP